MKVGSYLRTSNLAQAGQISVQQVRNYEASGFIPPAERSPAGYRLYTQNHLAALKTARTLVAGYGWQPAREIMAAVNQNDLAAALALIDKQHAELAAKRQQVEQTLAALDLLTNQPALATSRHLSPLRIGDAARQVGVRVSALYFWEQQGLLQPSRDKTSRYRLYDEAQMRRLGVIALLREANYNFETIHTILDELAAGQPEKAIAAIQKRQTELAKTSWACLTAMSAFYQYMSEFRTELCGQLAEQHLTSQSLVPSP